MSVQTRWRMPVALTLAAATLVTVPPAGRHALSGAVDAVRTAAAVPAPAGPAGPAVPARRAVTRAPAVAAVADRHETITPGVATPVTLDLLGQNVFLRFRGVAGRHVVITVTNVSLTPVQTPGDAAVPAAIETGGVVRDDAFQLGPTRWNEGAAPLETTGPTDLVLFGNQALGSLTITLRLVADRTLPLTLGTPVVVDPAVRGQNVLLPFDGVPGRRVALRLTQVSLRQTVTPLQPGVVATRLRDPNGALVEIPPAGTSQDNAWVTAAPLAVGGRYILEIDPLADSIGTLTMTATQPADLVRTVALGSPATVTLSLGQRARLSFAGVAGRRLSLSLSRSDFPVITQDPLLSGVPPTHEVLRPDGTQFDVVGPDVVPFRYGETDRLLDVTGTWTLRLDSDRPAAGTETFVLRLVTDQVATITPGADLPIQVGVPGRNVRLSFPATAGLRPVLQFKGQTWHPVVPGGPPVAVGWRMLRPDGTAGFDALAPATASGQSEGPALDAGGRWVLVLDPRADAVGTVTLRLSQVADPHPGALPIGTASAVTIGRAGENPVYTFAGRAGQHLVVRYGAFGLSNEFAPAGEPAAARITLLRPDGTGFAVAGPDLAAGVRFAESSFLFGPDRLLDVTGTWSLVVDGTGATVGSQPLTLQLVPDVEQAATAGRPVTVTVTRPGQNVALVLALPTGSQQLSYTATGSSFAQARLRASQTPPPVGRPLESPVPPGDSAEPLGQWGGSPPTVYVQLDPLGDSTGTVTLTFRFTPLP